MRELNPEIADVPREHLLIKIFRIFGVILSLLVLFLICLWTIKWYDREINDLPVIAALQGEIRIKPEDIKGEEILNKGFSVNTVLENSSGDTGDRKISLAPLPESVSDIENAPALLVPNSQNYSREALKSSITAALESLLGVEKKYETPITENIKLHLGSFPTADKANSHWFLLKQLNSELLRDFEQEVYKVNRDGKEFYRLGITGFPSLVIAEDICARLTDGGEQCVPATRDH